MFQIHPNKALGPDMMNPCFYMSFWSTCGKHIFEACESLAEDRVLLHGLNDINITFIPKCKNPTTTKDFHPILLSNMAYNVFSKVLANKLKLVLPNCVMEE